MREIIVDNFAGGGGASTGIELAIGRSVDIAINHDPNAVAMHSTNHPDTLHYCESVYDIDPLTATAGRPVGLAWFSSDCRHFSKAKGAKPVEKSIRGLAWIVIRWALAVRPRVMMLENVEEFRTWGPLLAAEMRPDPARAGETFEAFCGMLSGGAPADHPALAECCEFLGIAADGELVAGMHKARASVSPFWPSPGQFVAWCCEGKVLLGVSPADVMTELWKRRKFVYKYPTSEQYPWPQPLLYHVFLELRRRGVDRQMNEKELLSEAGHLLAHWEKRVAEGKPIPPVHCALAAPHQEHGPTPAKMLMAEYKRRRALGKT